MNYLAHFYLANPDTALMFGNFIGDGVRGSKLDFYPDEIARGIRFHRFIDMFTDGHPEVKAARKLFYPTQQKFSGVVVDMVFDYLLASQWHAYSEETLDTFANRCYDTIALQQHLLPPSSQRFFQFMISNDILCNYATVSGMERVFKGMDRRTEYDSNMVLAMNNAASFADELNERFSQFFPNLVEVCMQWKEEH